MLQIIHKITNKTNLSAQQAWWLLEFITGKNRSQIQFSSEQLSRSQHKQLEIYLDELSTQHKPLAYILGWMPFMQLALAVRPPILLPRPETEFWVGGLMEMLASQKNNELTILDVGTGSGCIALALAQALPKSTVYAVDISEQALDLARENAKSNNIANITFLHSNLFENLPKHISFDLIVSNPPYIDKQVQLEPSVTKWEDHNALFADNQGLQIIETIIKQAHSYLNKNNLPYQLVLEIDSTQGLVVQDLLKAADFHNITIMKDQFERDRTAWAK